MSAQWIKAGGRAGKNDLGCRPAAQQRSFLNRRWRDAQRSELTADFPAIAELSFPLGVEYQDVSSTLNYVAEVPHEDWSGIVAVVYNQSYYRFGQPLKGYVVTPCKYKAYLIEYGDCTAQKLIVYRFNNGILPPKY